MSYFDDASLVFIPSGTKVSKVYSVKPIDGTGDLTFTPQQRYHNGNPLQWQATA
jgi:hypothetical protein